MATAELIRKPIIKKVEKEVTDVVLTLSEPEAKTLAIILAKVGGCPKNSARKYVDNIMNSLKDNNYYWFYVQGYTRCFKDNKIGDNNIELDTYSLIAVEGEVS